MKHNQTDKTASAPETRKGFKETSAEMIMRLCEDINKLTAQRDELLAAAKRVEASWNITNRKTLASAMAYLRAAIAKAEGK